MPILTKTSPIPFETPYDPANGPIWINGYFGDAIFRTDQGICTITRKLAEKLGLNIQNEVMNGKPCPAVRAQMVIGTNNLPVNSRFFIYEDYFQDKPLEKPFYVAQDGQQHPPYEVILGWNFVMQIEVSLGFGNVIASSKKFGTVPPGSMRKFVKKYTDSKTYTSVRDNRVILLFDMDCFEVQVHEKPNQRGKPRVVVNSSDRILAVSYEAKLYGINRDATPYLFEARQKCPNLIAIYVPTRKSTTGGLPRPDTSIAREASAKIVRAIKTVLKRYGDQTVFEFSSNDEFFVDMTGLVNSYHKMELVMTLGTCAFWPKTFLYNGTVIGRPSEDYLERRMNVLDRKQKLSRLDIQETRLIFGASIANSIVKEILAQTNYQSSVGIGSNKLISKVGSGVHKPGSITILAPSGFGRFTEFIKAKDIPGLGGKLGQQIRKMFREKMKMKNKEPTMSDLRTLSDDRLAALSNGSGPIGLSKANAILFSANGICDKKVVPANCYQTSGISRRLYGKCFNESQMNDILLELVDEFMQKMEYEARVNSRSPLNVNMNIKRLLNENRSNLHSNIQILNEISSGYHLFETLLQSCVPQLYPWSPESKVESVHITATF